MTTTLERPARLQEFEARGAVQALFRSHDNEVLLSGAAGTGKSVGALMKQHLAALKYPASRHLIVRKTHASLTASTLVTFRKNVAAPALAVGALKFYGGSPQEPAAYRYANGSAIVVGGLDRPSRLLSTEYDTCLVDEAIECTAEDIDTIVTRLRNGVMPYQQLTMATNPGAPSHHLKQRVDAGRTTILYSTHEDNPRMHDGAKWTEYGEQYLTRLDSLTGARYQRMRWGRWVAAEGLVYEDFDPAIHVVDRLPAGSSQWTRWWTVDFGYSNPFVLQCWAQDPDGRLWLYREIYKTKTLVEDHARKILSIVRDAHGQWREPRPRAIICDHDAEDRATLERHLGMSTSPARKSVSDGIQATQARYKVQPDGKPRIFFVGDALVERDPALRDAKKPTCTLEEEAGYVWPDEGKNPDKRENPVKEDDHGQDAKRYMVAEVDLGGRLRVRFI
jgi:PBSX family phage terminase large subunit